MSLSLGLSAGPGTSAYISYVCWWWLPSLSNTNAHRPKISRTAYRRTADMWSRQTTTGATRPQTTTATRKTKRHEDQDSEAQYLQQQKHWHKLETTESWSVASLLEEPNIASTENPYRQNTQVDVLSKLPVARMTAIILLTRMREKWSEWEWARD